MWVVLDYPIWCVGLQIYQVIIPRTENTIKCEHAPSTDTNSATDLVSDINSELDEMDREEFYRLKKVVLGAFIGFSNELTWTGKKQQVTRQRGGRSWGCSEEDGARQGKCWKSKFKRFACGRSGPRHHFLDSKMQLRTASTRGRRKNWEDTISIHAVMFQRMTARSVCPGQCFLN